MSERAHPADPGFQSTPYERAMRDRYAFAQPFVTGRVVLDAPCGVGWGTSLLSGAEKTFAIDIDAPSLQYGREHYPNIHFLQAALTSLPLPTASIDTLLCLEGLEHLYYSEALRFLAEARRVLKPDGRLIITTPLLAASGRHSGNPFHHFEYSEPHFRDLLAPGFETVSLEHTQTPGGLDIRFVGAPKECSAEFDHRPAHPPLPLNPRLTRYLASLSTSTGFAYATGSPHTTLLSTAIGVLLAEATDTLPAAGSPEWEARSNSIRSCQDPDTGLFLDPLTAQFPITGELHDKGYHEQLSTYFSLHALDALGARPTHPLRYYDRFVEGPALEAWLDSLDWSNPWLESNRVMCLLNALIFRAEIEGSTNAPALFHRVLDWLDRNQEVSTSLWGVERGASLLNAVAGAYHFLPFYDFVQRPLRGIPLIIDAALSLQQEDGLFGPSPGGGACEDLDAIDVLCLLSRLSDHRAGEVKRALVRSFWAIHNLENPDGGFPYAFRTGPETYRFGSWEPLEVALRDSDVWSSWFRPLALHTIRARYPEDLPDLGPWRFRRLPALGYHRPCSESSTALSSPLWFRPLPARSASDAGISPQVAVVVTCFNLGKYLFEALQSVLSQSLPALEIVLIDDGSIDPFTLQYVRYLASQPGLKVIEGPNRGLPAARNLGIAAATAPYLCCLDADDTLHPDYLQNAVQVLDHQPRIGFVSCFYRTFDCSHMSFRYTGCRLPDLLSQNEACGVSVFRRDAWEKVGGYSTELSAMQDWDFWISILEAGYEGYVLPGFFFNYRARPGSMYTNTRRPDNYLRIFRQIVARHEDLYRRHWPDVLHQKTRQFAELVSIRLLELDEAERIRKRLQDDTAAWNRIESARHSELKGLTEAKDWLEGQVRNWEAAAASQRAYIEELTAQLAATRQESQLRQQDLLALQDEIAGLRQQLDSLRLLQRSTEERISLLSELLTARDNEIRSHLERARQLALEVQSLQDENASLRQQRDSLRESLEAQSARFWPAATRRAIGLFRLLAMLRPAPGFYARWHSLFLAARVLSRSDSRARWRAYFDPGYYLRANPDVAAAGLPAAFHFLVAGAAEQRNPSKSFSSSFYLSRHPDVARSGVNPLLHFCLYGESEGRTIAPIFQGRPPAPLSTPLAVPLSASLVHKDGHAPAPLVSVVIPCFNYGRYVENAIQSVLNQTISHVEIIVVEGGSTDGETPNVLRQLEARNPPRTRFLYRSEPHLAGDNRNFGIAAARGRYICCLDADDTIRPVYLETALFLADLLGHDIVYPSVACFGESDFKWMLTDATWPDIGYGNQISTVAVFRKSAWETVGGYIDTGKGDDHVAEDWDFWVRLMGAGFRPKSIRAPLLDYRVHRSGLWSTSTMSHQQQGSAIRARSAHLFAEGHMPAVASVDRSPHDWSLYSEPTSAKQTILFALPFITIGGAEKVFSTLARTLVQRGHKVVVITSLVLADTIRDDTQSFEAITPFVYPLPQLLQGQEPIWKDFLYFLLLRHRVDSVLIAGCDFLYQLLPDLKNRFPAVSVVDQLFNDQVHFHTNRHYRNWIDRTIVPSEALRSKILATGEDPDRVSIIPHGIEFPSVSSEERAAARTSLPAHLRDKLLIGFFGRLSAEKAPLDFVSIADRLSADPGIAFIMTGEGQERQAVLDQIARLGLSSRFYTPGFVDNVHSLMAIADVVVVPSHLDGMPLAVFEAQSLGRVVVASAVGSIPLMIDSGSTGFVCPPGDIEAFAAAIRKALADPQLRERIGTAASAWVRASHGADHMCDQYLRAFHHLAAGRR